MGAEKRAMVASSSGPEAAPLGSPEPEARSSPGRARDAGSFRLVVRKLGDPRITLACALTAWTVFGQTFLYFNRDLQQIAVAVGAACLADFLLALVLRREILVPLSAYITGLSVGILLESYDWRVYLVASTWGIASKYFLRAGDRH